MQLTILGSGTADLRKESHEAAYLLQVDNKNYLFDSGSGTIYRLLDVGVKIDQIENIFYTHFHNDHISDLPAILFSGIGRRKKPIHLFGPTGFNEYYDLLYKLTFKGLTPEFEIATKEVTNSEFQIDNLKITTKELKHYGDIAYRIEHNGKVLVYTGDTAYCKEIEDIAKDADVLVIECGKLELDEGELHLTPEECGKIAKAANVKKMILTHRYPIVDKEDAVSMAKCDCEVDLARDLMQINI